MSLMRILIGQYFANKVEEKIVDTSSSEIVYFIKENKLIISTAAIASLLFLIMLPITILSSVFAFAIWGGDSSSPLWTLFYLGTGITLIPLLFAIVSMRRISERSNQARRKVKDKIIGSSPFTPLMNELREERSRFQIEQKHVDSAGPMPHFY